MKNILRLAPVVGVKWYDFNRQCILACVIQLIVNNVVLVVTRHSIGQENVFKIVEPSQHVTRHLTMHQRLKRTNPFDVT